MLEIITDCGIEYVLDSWFYNDDYTVKIAYYVSLDGGKIVKQYK